MPDIPLRRRHALRIVLPAAAVLALSGSAVYFLAFADRTPTTFVDRGDLTVATVRRGRFAESYRRLYTVPVPELGSVAAQTLLSRVAELFARRLDEGGVRLESSAEPSGLTLEVDQILVEQVLINLVENALQAGASRIGIRVGLEARGRPVLRVTDDGHGMEREVLGSIFVPFFTTRRDGSGIGLSLSRHIMLLHHGSIDVESAPGEGSTFTLRF